MVLSTTELPPRRGPLARRLAKSRASGPFRPDFWRSPLRGPWLTSVLGTLLIPSITVIALTGFISHWAYYPDLPGNATSNPAFDIPVLFHFPASWPSWDYAATQGAHVTVGLMTLPLVLAKLWSVIPKLFKWPAARNLAGLLERFSLLLLVGSVLLEFATGIFSVEDYFPFHIDFYAIHYYGAWVFGTMFVLHACVKIPVVRRAYRERGVLKPLRAGLGDTKPEPVESSELVPVKPAAPTISRRGLLAMVGAGSLTIFAIQISQSIGGPLRQLGLLAPRGRVFGTGPNDFPITHTAASSGITSAMTGDDWRVNVVGARTATFSREQLLNMAQATETLTIGCTEGWSTTQHWTGVRLVDLATAVGAPPKAILRALSLESSGPGANVALAHDQWSDHRGLLAVRVNGADLSLDHGFPARVIVPGGLGEHNTKWVRELRFEAA